MHGATISITFVFLFSSYFTQLLTTDSIYLKLDEICTGVLISP